MANMMDYLDWRGDLSFAASGFNEVDNLILAQLVYVEFDGIVPGPEPAGSAAGQDEGPAGTKAGQDAASDRPASEQNEGPAGITLREASERFWSRHTEEEILARVSMTKSAAFVMRKAAETERFGGARLFGYVNDISDEEQSQFSVVCVRLSDGSLYVAFSGTDNTIVGWRENFNMGYLSETPGQLKAVDYLNRMIGPAERTVRVGGHSKGGNLSVYASVKCERSVRERIAAVYSNDGPGFSQEMLKSAEHQEMLPRIHTILPESSIVGMIMEHEEEYEVVRSANSGIGQHDAMSWEVLGCGFLRAPSVAQQSILLDEAFKSWLSQLDKAQREQIVDAAFTLLDEAGIRTVDDFYRSRWKTVQELLRARESLPEETKELFSRALKLLWKAGNDALRKNVKVNSKKNIKSQKIKEHMNK